MNIVSEQIVLQEKMCKNNKCLLFFFWTMFFTCVCLQIVITSPLFLFGILSLWLMSLPLVHHLIPLYWRLAPSTLIKFRLQVHLPPSYLSEWLIPQLNGHNDCLWESITSCDHMRFCATTHMHVYALLIGLTTNLGNLACPWLSITTWTITWGVGYNWSCTPYNISFRYIKTSIIFSPIICPNLQTRYICPFTWHHHSWPRHT